MKICRNLYSTIEAEAHRITFPDYGSAVVDLMASHLAPHLDNWDALGGPCTAFGEPLVPTNPRSEAYSIWKEAVSLEERHKLL